MKVVILAGGLGTRISEETGDKPKPMVLLDDKPILWHIMNIYASQGHKDFVIATGFKGEVIVDWISTLKSDWAILPVDTGLETQTGGRIKKCMQMFPGEKIMATYGDGVGNIDLKQLLTFHNSRKTLATLTATRPPARFGYLGIRNGSVSHFGEKSQSDAGWINGGYFVLEPEVAGLIKSDLEPFETGALPSLAQSGQLGAYKHYGFWQPMDTLREKQDLATLAASGTPPWFLESEI
jgi:glucose-1-phosphate cytidylyltransferase